MDDEDLQLYEASGWPPVDEADEDDPGEPERLYEATQAVRDVEMYDQMLEDRTCRDLTTGGAGSHGTAKAAPEIGDAELDNQGAG